MTLLMLGEQKGRNNCQSLTFRQGAQNNLNTSVILYAILFCFSEEEVLAQDRNSDDGLKMAWT